MCTQQALGAILHDGVHLHQTISQTSEMKRGLISYGGRKTNLAKRAVKQRPHIDPRTTATSQRIHFLSSGASSLPPFLSIYLILTDLFLGEEEDETEQTVRLPI